MVNSYLAHHGILGMKWGVRRYQNKDGSLTAAGEKRYGKLHKYHNENWIKKYKEKGLSEEEAKELAEKRWKAVKTGLIISGAVAATATGVYLYSEYGKKYFDTTIKAGTTIKNIHANPDRIKGGFAYVTSDKGHDSNKYFAILRDIDKKTLNTANVSKDIKIPSEKTAEKVFNDLMNTDKRFKENYEKDLVSRNYFVNHYADSHPKSSYEKWNVYNFVEPSASDRDGGYMKKTYMNKLKEMGYGGIRDFNDSHTDVKSNHSFIMFDTDNLDDFKSRNISAREIGAKRIKGYRNVIVDNLVRSPSAPIGAATVSLLAAGKYTSSKYDNDPKKAYKKLKEKESKNKKGRKNNG